MAVTSRPTAKKTSINFGNFGGNSDLGNVSPSQSKVSGASHIRSLQSQRRVLERVITLEEDVGNIQTRLQMQDESLLAAKSEFQQSLANVQDSIGTLQSGQKAIIDNAKETEKIKEKQRKLEEQRLKRKEAESDLEGPGAAAVDKDVKKKSGQGEKVAKKAQGILGTLGNFFKFVIAGWLTDKTFKLIEAFQSGNKADIKKIGIKLLAGAAAVGGIMLLAAGAIGPVIAGVFSLIGTLGALLLNPVTLTALLIAVGVGGAIYGIKKLWDWGRNRAAGGKKFKDAHKENWKKLEEAGVTQSVGGGMLNRWNVKRDGQLVARQYKNLTDEEKAAVDKFKAEKQRLVDLKKAMRKEMDEMIANTPKTGPDSAGRENKKWTKEDKAQIKAKKAQIRAKYEAMMGKSDTVTSGDGSNVGSTASGDTSASNIGPAETTEGNISVIPNYIQQVGDVTKGVGSKVTTLSSGNSDNMYIQDAKSNFNMF